MARRGIIAPRKNYYRKIISCFANSFMSPYRRIFCNFCAGFLKKTLMNYSPTRHISSHPVPS